MGDRPGPRQHLLTAFGCRDPGIEAPPRLLCRGKKTRSGQRPAWGTRPQCDPRPAPPAGQSERVPGRQVPQVLLGGHSGQAIPSPVFNKIYGGLST